MSRHRTASSTRRVRIGGAWLAISAATLATTGCGSDNGLMSRQDFVDNLDERGGELLDQNISSCMYDALDDQPVAREAVENWEDGEDVPEELFDLAVACLRDLPETPGT